MDKARELLKEVLEMLEENLSPATTVQEAELHEKISSFLKEEEN